MCYNKIKNMNIKAVFFDADDWFSDWNNKKSTDSAHFAKTFWRY